MASRQLLSAKKHRVELLQQRLNDALPEKQLARGYSITLKDGKAVKDASLLKEGEKVTTLLHQGQFESVITNCHSERSEESRKHKCGCHRDSSSRRSSE